MVCGDLINDLLDLAIELLYRSKFGLRRYKWQWFINPKLADHQSDFHSFWYRMHNARNDISSSSIITFGPFKSNPPTLIIIWDLLEVFCSFTTNIMAASNGTIDLSNPYTPMAFIRPELATKVTNQTYASIGALTVDLILFNIRLCIDYCV